MFIGERSEIMTKRLKKWIFGVLAISFIFCEMPYKVFAAGNEIVYSNSVGLKLTRAEMGRALQYLDKDDLDIFTQDEFVYLMSNPEKNIGKEKTVYVKTEEIVDSGGINYKDTTYENLQSVIKGMFGISQYAKSRNDNVSTSMKSITMKMYSVDACVTKVSLECKWLSIPKCKSYDVIAMRTKSKFASFKTQESECLQGFQYYDNSVINYNPKGKNFKYNNKGVGLSTNIVNSTAKKLRVKMAVSFVTSDLPITVYGTYQHAKQKTSLAQSQNYKISSDGMGKVLKFDSNVATHYDNTPGVVVKGSLEN